MKKLFLCLISLLLCGINIKPVLAFPPASSMMLLLMSSNSVAVEIAAGLEPSEIKFSDSQTACTINVSAPTIGSCYGKTVAVTRTTVSTVATPPNDTYIYTVTWRNPVSHTYFDVTIKPITQTWLDYWSDLYVSETNTLATAGTNTIKRELLDLNHIQFRTQVTRQFGLDSETKSIWSKVPSPNPGRISGDVYARSNTINVGRFTLDPRSVVAGNDLGVGTQTAAKQLKPYSINWDLMSKKLDRDFEKFSKEKAIDLPASTIYGTYYLNTRAQDPTSDQEKKYPEGGLWKYKNTSINIGDDTRTLTYHDQGTFLLEGDVIIGNNIIAADETTDFLFIFAKGDVEISDSVRQLKAVIYSTGSITLKSNFGDKSGPIEIKGMLIAKNNIILPSGDHKKSNIIYDNNIPRSLPCFSSLQEIIRFELP